LLSNATCTRYSAETSQQARETSDADSMEDCSSKRRVLPPGGR
jgi:hypothetical protein